MRETPAARRVGARRGVGHERGVGARDAPATLEEVAHARREPEQQRVLDAVAVELRYEVHYHTQPVLIAVEEDELAVQTDEAHHALELAGLLDVAVVRAARARVLLNARTSQPPLLDRRRSAGGHASHRVKRGHEGLGARRSRLSACESRPVPSQQRAHHDPRGEREDREAPRRSHQIRAAAAIGTFVGSP